MVGLGMLIENRKTGFRSNNKIRFCIFVKQNSNFCFKIIWLSKIA